jgi:hypothetical protein
MHKERHSISLSYVCKRLTFSLYRFFFGYLPPAYTLLGIKHFTWQLLLEVYDGIQRKADSIYEDASQWSTLTNGQSNICKECCSCSSWWGKTMSLNCSQKTGLLFTSQLLHEHGEPLWNDTNRGKQKNLEKNLSQYHLVHHKSHMD